MQTLRLRSWKAATNDVSTYILISLLVLATILSTHNLAYYPQPWFDEGWYLQIPKNLVQHGMYATQSSEGFRRSDTVIGVSPLFYLPIAGVFKVWGIGLVQARGVIVGYFLLTCLLVYAIARKLYGSRAGLVALALFITVRADDDFTSAVLLGRQVMAEIPALFFLMAAFYCWLMSFERKTNLFLILAGIAFGLAMTTKAQFLLVVLPMLIAAGILDRLYYRQRRYRYFILPFVTSLAVIVLQYLFVFLVMGPNSFSRYLSDFSAASGPQVRVLFSPISMQTALKFFLRSDYFIWVAPALVYGIFLCADKKPDNIKPSMIWVFVGGWLTWFLVASVGWARYTFPALAVSYILTAKLLDDLAGPGISLGKVVGALRGGERMSVARAASMVVLLIALMLNSSADVIKGIFAAPNPSAQEFAAYIDAHVGQGELIETWEWEIAFLTHGRDFHHPPTSLLNLLIAHVHLGAAYDPNTYDFQRHRPAYIAIGRFAKWTGLYPAKFLEQECTLVKSIGEYDLYRVNASPTKRSTG